MRSRVGPGSNSEAMFVPKLLHRGNGHDVRRLGGGGDVPVRPTEPGRAAKGLMSLVKSWARTLRRDAHAIFLASRDPQVPWAIRLFALAVAGYALSPIDLIPDFIPVLGIVDDLIIVPLGICLVSALIPEEVMGKYRAVASAAAERPVSRTAAIVIIAWWISGAALLGWIVFVHWRA